MEMKLWKKFLWSPEKRAYMSGDSKLTGVNKWFNSNFVEKADFEEIRRNVAQRRGVPEDVIQAEWDYKRDRGTVFHDFIEAVVLGKYYKIEDEFKEDFLKFKSIILRTLEIFKNNGYEIYSSEEGICGYGLIGKMDTVFIHKGKKKFVIVDWKFVEKFRVNSYNYKNLINELADFEDCHFYKYLTVGEIYRLLLIDNLPEEYKDWEVKSIVVNFRRADKPAEYHFLSSLEATNISKILLNKLKES